MKLNIVFTQKVIFVLFLYSNFLHGFLSQSSYDRRTTQMKFNFDYNQYDSLLTQSLVQHSLAPSAASINYNTNDMLALGINLSSSPFYNFLTESGVSTNHGINWKSADETHFVGAAAFTISSPSGAGTLDINLEQNLGIFDSNNGLGMGINYNPFTGPSSDRTELKFFIKNNGVTNYYYANGVTPSDITKINLYRIIVTDKSTGPIRFDFYNGDQWDVMHTFTHAESSLSSMQLRTLQLPVAAQVKAQSSSLNNGSFISVNSILQTSEWQVYSIGDVFETKQRNFSKSLTSTIGSTETHILTLKNNSTFNTKNNWVAIKIKDFIGYGLNANIFSGIFKIYKNATVVGTTFTSVDANNSVVSYSTDGTYTDGTGTEKYSSIFSTAIGTVTSFNADDMYIVVSPGETITITAQLPYTPSGDVFTSIRWAELF